MYMPLVNRNTLPRFAPPWKFGGGTVVPSINVAVTVIDADERFAPAALHSWNFTTIVPPRGLALFGSYCRQTLYPTVYVRIDDVWLPATSTAVTVKVRVP